MLSKKKSRPITVNDQKYRWAIAPDGEYVTLVVQHAESNGQKLEIIIKTDVNRFWLEFPNTGDLNMRVVTPSLVSNLIEEALNLGWLPTLKNSPLELSLNEEEKLQVRRGLAQ